jgi:carbonic anhydrase/acetyltransferase-like protein (isoleucine patch superfamily)
LKSGPVPPTGTGAPADSGSRLTLSGMPLYSLDGKQPRVADDAFVAPSASVIGDVIIESGASIWYSAVIRADYSTIIIRAGANVQDGSVLHSPPDVVTEVGAGATIGHLCMIHGAVIGEQALIGNGSTVLDGSLIGARCLVAAHSLVRSGSCFEPEAFIAGVPAVAKRSVTGTPMAELLDANGPAYVELACRHSSALVRLD